MYEMREKISGGASWSLSTHFCLISIIWFRWHVACRSFLLFSFFVNFVSSVSVDSFCPSVDIPSPFPLTPRTIDVVSTQRVMPIRNEVKHMDRPHYYRLRRNHEMNAVYTERLSMATYRTTEWTQTETIDGIELSVNEWSVECGWSGEMEKYCFEMLSPLICAV